MIGLLVQVIAEAGTQANVTRFTPVGPSLFTSSNYIYHRLLLLQFHLNFIKTMYFLALNIVTERQSDYVYRILSICIEDQTFDQSANAL